MAYAKSTMSIAARRFQRRRVSTGGGGLTQKLPYGVMPWGNPYQGSMAANTPIILAQPWVGGVSAFCRWAHISNNGSTWNFAPFDAISAAANAAGKPWMLMVILGSIGTDIADYVVDAVPTNEWIFTDGYTFPVFWSPTANDLRTDLFTRLANRYNNDPWLAGVRMTTFWSKHGEPWFAGGEPGKAKWVNIWNSTGHSGDLSTVQAAYQQHEKDKWTEMMGLFSPHIAVSAAAGDALYDVNGSITDTTQPARHPDRLATWTWLRQQYGVRSTFQFNGVNAGNGASGYGKWLSNSFSTLGSVPSQRQGRIGAQPVAGAGTANLSYDGFVTMIRNLTSWKYSYCEVYFADAWAAYNGANADAIKIRNVMIEQKDNWTHA